jgi:predicted  nucleic acid-binding Zn-ribbon protein
MTKECTMRYQAFVRAAATVLSTALLCGGAVYAQTTQPQPATMTDTAPANAADRSSVGAVIMMDQPVLAQREAMQQAQARSAVDTRSMGAGPARLLQRQIMDEDLKQKRAEEAADRQRGTPN